MIHLSSSKLKTTICVILLGCISIGCLDQNNPVDEHFILLKDFKNLLYQYDRDYPESREIIVIPGVGCTGCISEAEVFFEDNYESTDYFFVFTGITDPKLFNNQISLELQQRNNVLIDRNNILMDVGYNSIYPSYLELTDNNKFILKQFTSK